MSPRVRHVIAAIISIFGVLTASVSQLNLPPVVSAVMVAAWPLLVIVEHYVEGKKT